VAEPDGSGATSRRKAILAQLEQLAVPIRTGEEAMVERTVLPSVSAADGLPL
jgi:hypothetical protein